MYIRKGDEWNKVDPIATANGNRYELRTGETYRVIRALPEEYVGVFHGSWYFTIMRTDW